jgi:hypothetical protein
VDHVLILGERHLGRVLAEYVAHSNGARPHQGIGQRIPASIVTATAQRGSGEGHVPGRRLPARAAEPLHQLRPGRRPHRGHHLPLHLAAAYLVRRRPRTLALTLLGLGCNLTATLIWATLINPINRRTLSWSAGTLAPAWPAVRDRWHTLHAARLILSPAGFGALVASVLDDARPARSG